MHSQAWIAVARAVAGFLMLSHVVGLLWFPLRPASLSFVYGVLVVVAMGAFCFLPRRVLRRARALVVCLAFAAVCATLAEVYGDIRLVGGADYGALVLRSLVVGILVIMLREAAFKDAKADEDI